MPQLILLRFEAGDVREQGHILFDVAPCVPHRNDVLHQRDGVTVFVPIPEFARPMALFLQRLKHGLVKLFVLNTCVEKARIVT